MFKTRFKRISSTPLQLWPIALLVPMAVACGEPTREEARDDIAQVRCERFEECGDIGSGETFSSLDDCVVNQKQDFNDRWPSDRCAEGHLNEELYENCLKRASTIACDGSARATDQQAFDRECSARKLCTDKDTDDRNPPPPKREEYRDDIARSLCNRAIECDTIGEDKRYKDYDECMQESRKDIDDVWPEDRCATSIDPTQFDVCNDKAATATCQAVGGFVALLDFLATCNANRVCTQN